MYVHSLSEILKNASPFGVSFGKFEISYYIKIIKNISFMIRVKVAFIQKGLMRLSFLQRGKPPYFPELKF